MEKTTSNNQLIIDQAEYYLSDENLKQDEFFNKEISSSDDMFINIDCLLKCNKMKMLTTKKAEIVKALKNSKFLELSKDEEKFRRRDMKLPALTLLNKKRVNNENKPIEGKSKDKEIKNEVIQKDPKDDEISIFSIKTSNSIELGWKEIQQNILSNNPGLIISYLRFSSDSGNLGIANKHIKNLVNSKIKIECNVSNSKVIHDDEVKDKNKDTDGKGKLKSTEEKEAKETKGKKTAKERKSSTSKEVKEQTTEIKDLNESKSNLKLSSEPIFIEITKCQGNDLVDFWRFHGEHLKMCLNKDNRNNKYNNKNTNKKFNSKKTEEIDIIKKKSDSRKGKTDSTKLNKPISLGKNKFIDIKDIRQKSRSILNSVKEGEKPIEDDSKFLMDILNFHPNKDKASDFDHFSTGQNPNFPESKCYMIVKKDGTKIDFSINKCLDKIQDLYVDKN